MREGLGSRRTASGRGTGNGFFTEQRLLAYGSTVAVAYAIRLAWRLFQHQWYLASYSKHGCIDFAWMWVSGAVARSSDPALVYKASAWSAAWRILTGLDDCKFAANGLGYPPTYLFFTYPLGLMPYSTAFAVWLVATLLLYLAAVYAIIPRPAAVIAALTPYTVIINALLGQNGFLTAGLIGLSLAFMERRPWLSGVFLGLLTGKPHLGIIFPFALLAARNWRTLASATATSVILGAAAAMAFGYHGWPSFIHSVVGRNADLVDDPQDLVSVFSFLVTAGVSARISWAVHLAVAVAIAAAVCAVWANPVSHSLKAAALCVASVTVTPYVLTYDLCILSIAVAFLVGDGLARGFLRGEREVMLIFWFGLFIWAPILWAPPVPQLIICLALLALVARRIVVYPSGSRGTGQSFHSGDEVGFPFQTRITEKSPSSTQAVRRLESSSP